MTFESSQKRNKIVTKRAMMYSRFISRSATISKAFCHDNRGSLAIMFAMMLLVFAGTVGMAIDYGRAANERSKLQKAGDAAALSTATAAAYGMDIADLPEFALAAFNANISGSLATSTNPVITINDSLVTVNISSTVKSTFSKIIGVNTIDVGIISEAVIPAKMKAEIALVLDYSGSMNSAGKYDAMRDAAIKLIDDMSLAGGDQLLKVGLVPFSDHIYLSLPGNNVVGQDPFGTWSNCTKDRQYPHNTENSEPSGGDDTTKWTSEAPADNGGSGSGVCPEFVSRNLIVMPLTDDLDSVKSQLNNMLPYANTHIALGMSMGWHLISPDAPFSQGAEYSDKETKKFIILLTDGVQTTQANGPGNSKTVSNGELNLKDLCESVKDQNVTVITVAFDLQDVPTTNRLKNCATSPSYFFEADSNSDLAAAFADISGKLAGDIRLIR